MSKNRVASAAGRRILRSGDSIQAPAASLLVDMGVSVTEDGSAGLTAMLEEARREGRDEGYREATAEMAAAEATGRASQLRRVADAVTTAARAVGEARREAVDDTAAEAAALAFELARAVLQRELSIGRPEMEAVIRALRLVPDGHDLVVRLHPDDAVTLDEVGALVPDAAVKLVSDPRVEHGGCVVVAGPCRIDAQIGSALERARSILAEVYPEAAGHLSEEKVECVVA